LGTVAGETISEQLDMLRTRKWNAYPNKPSAYRIIYVQSHVRTRQWFKSGETFVWDDGASNGNAVYAQPKTKRRTQSL
jgi:DNA (cytosine-5)-methyltransferase 1